jgi:hypothetical protein
MMTSRARRELSKFGFFDLRSELERGGAGFDFGSQFVLF